MSEETLKTLQKSLLELSKQNTVHYETVATQLRETRLAILRADGVNFEDFFQYEPKMKIIEQLNNEIQQLSERVEVLRIQEMRMKAQREKAKVFWKFFSLSK